MEVMMVRVEWCIIIHKVVGQSRAMLDKGVP
jgi:hypothetical protein